MRTNQLWAGRGRASLFGLVSAAAIAGALATGAWVLAEDCFYTTDPQQCCNVAAIHFCGPGWLCTDQHSGPYEEPRVAVGASGKQHAISGPEQLCIYQKRKCGAASPNCVDDGDPILSNCSGLIPDPNAADCGGGGGGET